MKLLRSAVDRVVAVVLVLAIAVVIATVLVWPLPTSRDAFIAFAALFALTLLSTTLALKITEGGTTTAMEFLPLLSGIILLGPSAAVLLTAAAKSISQTVLHRKPPKKAVFNVAQVVLGIGAAGIVFHLLGGRADLYVLPFIQTIGPFLAAAITLFAVNALCVTFVISAAESRSFGEVWQQIFASIIWFDVAISPLSYVVAVLYVNYGAVTLVLAVVPIVGLRYSYGVNLELKQLNRDLLRVLIKALEERDPYTSGHSVRVAEHAKAISSKLGLSNKRTRNIETAALLHDIGKIDTDFNAILRNTGELTDDQVALIQEHPRRGVELIGSIRSLDSSVLDCVLHHHERWDGEGYPDGLQGDNIPIGARIIMVADTIDAMSTIRPYRDALDDDVIRKELRKYSGSQFDPEVVKAALESETIWPTSK